MARGYPEPADDAAYPILDDVLAEDTCIICKKRPAERGTGECAVCYAALHE